MTPERNRHLSLLRKREARLREGAVIARNAGFNPLAERQAAELERDADAIAWALAELTATDSLVHREILGPLLKQAEAEAKAEE